MRYAFSMHDGKTSETAAGVAFFRAVSSLPGSPFRDVDDPLASSFLHGPWKAVFGAASASRLVVSAIRTLSFGLLDHIALRTAAIDAAVRAAVAGGARQLVLLGAGLDARAFRMVELADVMAYEVDFPATQHDKRARLGDTAPRAGAVRFVAIDFERDSLGERLDGVGHDVTLPTVWIWEGVTPYLAREATTATLDVVAARSAPSSTLIVSYLTPEHAAIAFRRARPRHPIPVALLPVAHAVFRILGEPVRGVLTPGGMAALLEARSFEVRSDSGSGEWAKQHPVRGGESHAQITERVAVATKASSPGS